jgi:exodeoxyribonuclease VIII
MSLSNAEYHARPEVSKSGLDLVHRSPLHYWNRYLNPDREPEDPTPAMMIGSALHTAVLEPHLFDDEYAVAPACDRRTKEGKMIWADFEQQAAGKTLLKAEDATNIELMSAAVRQHKAAGFLLRMPGRCEQSYFWTDETSGEKCKCRPDWHSEDRLIIADVKTCEDASPGAFLRKAVFAYRYHVQAAFYSKGLGAKQFIFIAVEKKAPYAVGVYTLPAELVERGWQEAQADLQRLAECRAANQWPGYGESIQELPLPAWLSNTSSDQILTEIEGF